MLPREKRQLAEKTLISEYGVLSENSKGRERPEEECDLRTCFQRDTDRIIHSKAFRRLKHKTQVFLQPEGDHYRTRLTHTLEVMRLARTIARSLELKEDLAEAIALGHDLGHTPFGHAGERALDAIMQDCGGFRHYDQSLRVVERLEKDGRGLNLTYEVRDGIVRHTDVYKRQAQSRGKSVFGLWPPLPQMIQICLNSGNQRVVRPCAVRVAQHSGGLV